MWLLGLRKDAFPGPWPLLLVVDKRAGPEVKREGKLTLPITNCSIVESGPYTFPGQHRRASPEGVGMTDNAEDVKQENWLHPILIILQGVN